MKIRTLTAADVVFTLTCEPEDERIEGNASAWDPETDRKAEEWIKRELKRGNEWAWCCAKVTATFESWEGVDYLGCCSYESEEDFRKPGGYFDDMKERAMLIRLTHRESGVRFRL